jgi:hypothetical protein
VRYVTRREWWMAEELPSRSKFIRGGRGRLSHEYTQVATTSSYQSMAATERKMVSKLVSGEYSSSALESKVPAPSRRGRRENMAMIATV